MTHHISLSGGLDSTAALAFAHLTAHGDGSALAAWSFDYGQSHARELRSAKRVGAFYGVESRTLPLMGLLHGSALLGAEDLPEGHYAAESMKATVVNGRNLLFIAAIAAQTQPGDSIWLGVHAGDHFIYPDCRPGFTEPLAEALASAYDILLITPFIAMTKAEIIEAGTQLGAPPHETWSCYAGGTDHCGRCGTCVERAEAFHLAQIPDPTTYADPDFWRRAEG